MEGTSWTMSNNYFTSPTGKIVTQWPHSCSVYRVFTKVFGPCERDDPPTPGRLTK